MRMSSFMPHNHLVRSTAFFPFQAKNGRAHYNILVKCNLANTLTVQRTHATDDAPVRKKFGGFSNNFPVDIKAKFMTPYISSLTTATGSVTSLLSYSPLSSSSRRCCLLVLSLVYSFVVNIPSKNWYTAL